MAYLIDRNKQGSSLVVACVAGLLFAGGALLWAQTQDITFYTSHIDLLIGEGKYNEALDLLKTRIQEQQALHQVYEACPYYALLGKFYVEVGLEQEAAQALQTAEDAASRSGLSTDSSQSGGSRGGRSSRSLHDSETTNTSTNTWDDIVTREQASFLLVKRDYDGAAKEASKAYRAAGDHKDPYLLLAYCQSLEAQARLRLGQLDRAQKLIGQAVKEVPDSAREDQLLYAPRILFTSCLVKSYSGSFDQAISDCQRGIALIGQKGADSRDVPLGYLALAEAYLQSGDTAKCRESATKAMNQTNKVFGVDHPDTVTALELLARADAKDGKIPDAESHARDAVRVATNVFGKDAKAIAPSTQVLNEVTKGAQQK